jgi:serine-type D-Ala-D-Ala endopeptidase (penicillin-binding protein 7)
MRILVFTVVLCSLLFNWREVYADAKPMSITASSWLVADEFGRVIESKNADEQRSIASISKLMTVMVVLDAHQDLDERIGQFTRKETIQLALIKSDNHAAEVLCENYPGGRSACITAMNAKARFLNLPNTHYVEPTGLSIMNTSTAEELVTIVMDASTYQEIVECAKMSNATVKRKKRLWTFSNTNPLIKTHDFIVSKTGYIRASGGCIVMMIETKLGRRIVVLLGSKNTHTRIPEALSLAENY